MGSKKTKSTKGFTLMELIIVMALLAIIAAILIPMFLNTTDRARLRSDIQSARVIQNAIDLYRVETGRTPAGANVADIMATLSDAGHLDLRNATEQTEGAIWTQDSTRGIVVDISASPPNVRDAYANLPDAERRLVIGTGTGS